MENQLKITCPKCGYEYLAAEILYPKYLLGTCSHIERDESGKITKVIGEEPSLIEDWECENCGCSFKVEANIELNVKYDSKYDFSDNNYSIKF